MVFIIFIIILLLVLFFLLKHLKILNLPNITLITGGVKTGKSSLAVYLAIKKYKSVLFSYYIKKYLFFKKIEKPLLYSNIPLRKIKFVPLSKDLLFRNMRFAYGSVLLVDEASLVADSQSYKDDFTSEVLTIFNKLYGHSTKGGYLFYDTQNVSDVHYAIKRVCSTYLWIQKCVKLPFFLKLYVREVVNSESQDNVNTFQKDVDDEVDKFLLIPKKIWKRFDCYCYSIFTDDLPVANNVRFIKDDSLKADSIIQVRNFHSLYDCDEIGFIEKNVNDLAIKEKLKSIAFEKFGLKYKKR